MLDLTIKSFRFTIEFFGLSAVYIRIGSFERFYNSDGLPSH